MSSLICGLQHWDEIRFPQKVKVVLVYGEGDEQMLTFDKPQFEFVITGGQPSNTMMKVTGTSYLVPATR